MVTGVGERVNARMHVRGVCVRDSVSMGNEYVHFPRKSGPEKNNEWNRQGGHLHVHRFTYISECRCFFASLTIFMLHSCNSAS